MATVLSLDKDPLQLDLIALLLRKDRHRVITTSDPDNALSLMQREAVDLAIIETALPGHDGYRICREMLEARPYVGLMIVSERRDETEIVRGLLAGADDYLVKPYSPREFLARVQVILRRTQNGSRPAKVQTDLSIGDVTLSVSQVRAVVNGHHVPLTPREFSLLHSLMSDANRVLTREQLTRSAWGDAFVAPKAVDVCIQRLRKKIGPYLFGGSYVHAVRGYGYKFAKPTPSFDPVASPGQRPRVLTSPSSRAVSR